MTTHEKIRSKIADKDVRMTTQEKIAWVLVLFGCVGVFLGCGLLGNALWG